MRAVTISLVFDVPGRTCFPDSGQQNLYCYQLKDPMVRLNSLITADMLSYGPSLCD